MTGDNERDTYVFCSKSQHQIPAALHCRGSVVRDHEGLIYCAADKRSNTARGRLQHQLESPGTALRVAYISLDLSMLAAAVDDTSGWRMPQPLDGDTAQRNGGAAAVVSDDGDGGAAEADIDEDAGKVEPKDGGDQGRSTVAGGHDARAALVGGGGSHRRRGVPLGMAAARVEKNNGTSRRNLRVQRDTERLMRDHDLARADARSRKSVEQTFAVSDCEESITECKNLSPACRENPLRDLGGAESSNQQAAAADSRISPDHRSVD
ncbi:hypothetical protein B0H16DRAFT_1467807 [Mycena metata]|uniref:Uncharacterized protein n=1 Tax=Mycena metata TaxID=1033252 RepID=A0AAD7I2V3_9AGAR|nr:hypothetical protein B0H16DRAFT_1467807 [Mycena metata]